MRRAQTGIGLIELVIAITLISIAVSSVLLALSMAVGASADPNRVQQAIAIAETYMEEIRLHDFADPDTTPVEGGRSLYDDVVDYDGLDDSPPLDQSGADLDGASDAFDGYRVRVSVAASSTLGPGGEQVPAADAWRINVRVSYGNEVDYTLTGHRTNY